MPIIHIGMDKDKIVMVTGAPRSGTSLQMQTLDLLGVPINGDRFPEGNRDKIKNHLSERQKEQSENLNPKGFYEIGGVVIWGVRDISDYKGKAVNDPGQRPGCVCCV